MWFKSVYIKSVFFSALLMSPVWSQAASFPCDQSHLCDAQTVVQPQHQSPPQVTSNKVTSNQVTSNPSASNSAASNQVVPSNVQKNSLSFYLENLQLTPMQYAALDKVRQSQFPLILQSVRNLEDAHSKLRYMAIHNAYDQPAAEALTQTIVDHTANLAVLDAQREYEIFAMLSPEQVRRYQAMVLQSY